MPPPPSPHDEVSPSTNAFRLGRPRPSDIPRVRSRVNIAHNQLFGTYICMLPSDHELEQSVRPSGGRRLDRFDSGGLSVHPSVRPLVSWTCQWSQFAREWQTTALTMTDFLRIRLSYPSDFPSSLVRVDHYIIVLVEYFVNIK